MLATEEHKLPFNICHITSVHKRNDTRIFLKQLKTISLRGYNATFIVADGMGDDNIDGIHILDAIRGSDALVNASRLFRWTKILYLIYKTARRQNSDIYHIHDPELLIVGVFLKYRGHRVIYDSHEDLPRAVMSKPYIPKFLRRVSSAIIYRVENILSSHMNYIITATPSIAKRFDGVNKKVSVISNYPFLAEFQLEKEWGDRENTVCYLGNISEIRGVRELVMAMIGLTNIKLEIAGVIRPKSLEDEIKSLAEGHNVVLHGELNREQSASMLGRAKLGVVLFYPEPNHIEALPNKLFEYMSAGLPVLCSNFPLWESLVLDTGCGLTAVPTDVESIRSVIKQMFSDDLSLKVFGAKGREQIEEKYSWESVEEILLEVYSEVSMME